MAPEVLPTPKNEVLLSRKESVIDMNRLTQCSIALALVCGYATQSSAQVNVPAGNSWGIPVATSTSLACTPLMVAGAADVSGLLAQASDISIVAGGSVVASGVVQFGGNLSNLGTFTASTGTVTLIDDCALAPASISGTFVFNNLTLSSANGRTIEIASGANITVNGTLTLQGAPGQPITLTSENGTPVVITLGPGAVVSRTNAAVAPSVSIGAATGPGGPTAAIPTLSELAMVLLTLAMVLATSSRRWKW